MSFRNSEKTMKKTGRPEGREKTLAAGCKHVTETYRREAGAYRLADVAS
jgi:hypothetical protein